MIEPGEIQGLNESDLDNVKLIRGISLKENLDNMKKGPQAFEDHERKIRRESEEESGGKSVEAEEVLGGLRLADLAKQLDTESTTNQPSFDDTFDVLTTKRNSDQPEENPLDDITFEMNNIEKTGPMVNTAQEVYIKDRDEESGKNLTEFNELSTEALGEKGFTNATKAGIPLNIMADEVENIINDLGQPTFAGNSIPEPLTQKRQDELDNFFGKTNNPEDQAA